MSRIFSLIYGVLNYAAFLATSAYEVCFVGDLAVPRMIDRGLESPLYLAIATRPEGCESF